MDELFYYHKRGLRPFRSLMELSNDEATAFMKANLSEEQVFHRNPAAYLHRRRATESWLFESFRNAGGTPVLKNPLYMTLGRSSYIESLDLYSECIRVPLSLFEAGDISFTYPDSYVSKWLAETQSDFFNASFHGKLFTLASLPRLLTDGRATNEAWKLTDRKYDYFIEAQIWNPQVLSSYLINPGKRGACAPSP